MLYQNSFFIKKLSSIIFIGYSDLFQSLITINKSLGLKTLIISSSDQVSKEDKKRYKIFNKLDKKFKKYIKDNVDIDQTLFVSLGSRFIFKKKDIKEFFRHNIVNFHGSRLPLDAGGGGMSWRILRGDRIDNQLVHLIDDGIDTGPILDYEKNIFPSDCKIPIQYEKFSKRNFINFYKKFIKKILNKKNFPLISQPKYLGRYNPRLNSRMNGWIDWNLEPNELLKFINAFDDPYYGSQTMINNKKVRIKKTQIHSGDSSNHPFMTGLISRHDGDWIVVSSVGKEMFLIEEVIDDKNKNIIQKLKVGDRFITPLDKIYLSKKNRPKYNSMGLKKKN